MEETNVKAIIRKRIEKTKQNLEKNRMECIVAQSAGDVVNIVKELLEENSVVANGGSQTLIETGVIDLLRSGNYKYLDRSGLSGDAIKKCYKASLSADTYLCSANAITEKGELYNVDGNGNRVAALCYGPDSVIVVAGCNKIVADIHEAITRVKNLAAPTNALRLGCDTYCHEKGECMAYASGDSSVTGGCRSEDRICCSYVITGYQRVPGRIKVILVCEELGY